MYSYIAFQFTVLGVLKQTFRLIDVSLLKLNLIDVKHELNFNFCNLLLQSAVMQQFILLSYVKNTLKQFKAENSTIQKFSKKTTTSPALIYKTAFKKKLLNQCFVRASLLVLNVTLLCVLCKLHSTVITDFTSSHHSTLDRMGLLKKRVSILKRNVYLIKYVYLNACHINNLILKHDFDFEQHMFGGVKSIIYETKSTVYSEFLKFQGYLFKNLGFVLM